MPFRLVMEKAIVTACLPWCTQRNGEEVHSDRDFTTSGTYERPGVHILREYMYVIRLQIYHSARYRHIINVAKCIPEAQVHVLQGSQTLFPRVRVWLNETNDVWTHLTHTLSIWRLCPRA